MGVAGNLLEALGFDPLKVKRFTIEGGGLHSGVTIYVEFISFDGFATELRKYKLTPMQVDNNDDSRSIDRELGFPDLRRRGHD